ncbi:PAS domain S-box protein [Agrobacterium rubi]|uniref:PAS domain S-box protein n=1 Tax=Agrobacterium rubi TaxID=28099 RepID=UPI001572EA5C|nr:PAS domain S-box protein [Agrobacterium rubi]NTF06697.1 PAS domain S-box protein [Agrobacterium rubi]NTF18939.1 PAS domain S-box protein [Agrobacterium rubi]NTF25902.1 PAS domain S-box protein [Agrobacterium rubi]
MPAGSTRPSYLPETGETADLIHQFDWSTTSLGPIEQWSSTVRTAVAMMLRSPVAIATLWGDDGIMIYNDAYVEIAGKRHPGLLGAKLREGWPEAANFNDAVMKTGMAGKTLSYKDQEFTLFRNGGPEHVWLDLDYSPVVDDEGVTVGVFAVVRDTSERVKASHQLEALNEDLERQVLERVLEQGTTWNINPDMLAVVSMEGRFLATNPAWGKTLGYSAQDMRGFAYTDLLHPDDIPHAKAALAKLIAGEAVIEAENRYRAKNGAYRWFSWVCVPDHGKIYCIIRDVTDEKTARAERDQLWRLSQDMLARASYDGELSAVNPAWSVVLGWSELELLRNPYADIIHPEDVAGTTAALMEMAKTGHPTRFENRVLTKTGVWTPIDWTVSPEADNVNFIAVGRDLSEYKAREAELVDAQEQLRQAQKIEAIGQLTGGLAHDFNNILAGIGGSLEMMKTRLAQGRIGELDRYLVEASAATKRAAGLTQRLLAFSRRQTLDPKPTDLNSLVNGILELVHRSIGPSIEVETASAQGLWTTFVDAGQLENALLNLCINARDAMPEGGKITIETGNHWLDERAAKEQGLKAGEYVSLCVSDTGTGMSADVMARAFDPFYTTKPIGQGTGLGLSMVHGFAGQSDGAVRIDSKVGHGTTICIFLPRHSMDVLVEEAKAEIQSPTPQSSGGETILVVDDEPLVRMIAVEQLEDLGYAVLEAGDGASAMAILNSDQRIDLLVTDVGLPNGMNGRQLAEAARLSRPDLGVLFITGYAENAVLNHGHLDHGMHVMTKPFQMDVFARKVNDMIGRSS